jgi:hypothetical protein
MALPGGEPAANEQSIYLAQTQFHMAENRSNSNLKTATEQIRSRCSRGLEAVQRPVCIGSTGPAACTTSCTRSSAPWMGHSRILRHHHDHDAEERRRSRNRQWAQHPLVDLNKSKNKSTVEVVATILHATGVSSVAVIASVSGGTAWGGNLRCQCAV